MPTLTTNPALARKRIAAIDGRLARYPDHPQKEKMLTMRDGYRAALDAPKAPPEDRLLARVETLVAAVRKIDVALATDPKHPNKKRMVERRDEYRTSLTNIQEFGREKKPTAPEGVNIQVPADVLASGSE